MLVSNSLLKTLTNCERQAYYKVLRQLAPRRVATQLKRGGWLHELLETHYKGDNWRKRHRELVREFNQLDDETKDYYGDLPGDCYNIMARYCLHWKRKDRELKIIAVERVFEIPWPHGHTFQGKFDVIVEDDFGRWLMEHKSHKTLPDDNYRFKDIQTARYVWSLNKLGTYGEITGVLWNYLTTTIPKTPQILKDGSRLSKRKIKTDAYTFIKAIQKYGLDPEDYRDDIIRLKRRSSDYFRRVPAPIVDDVVVRLVQEGVLAADRLEELERGATPLRNIGRQCDWCSYEDLCIVDLYGGNSRPLIKAKYTKEDPLAYHGTTEETSG